MKKSEFEWLSDEDATLIDGGGSEANQGKVFWRRFGFWVLLTVVIAGLVFYISLDQKQSAVQNEEEQSIALSFKLWHEAVMDNDPELFNLSLAKKDRSWVNSQKRLFNWGLALNRAPLGLQVIEVEMQTPQIDLSADLQKATLTFDQIYHLDQLVDGEVVKLRHSFTTIKEGERWQIAPMDDDFWGEWQHDEGEFLYVQYKARDTEIVERLSRDLNSILAFACNEAEQNNYFGVSCADFSPYTLILSIDPPSMQGFLHPATSLQQDKTIVLPTPTLVGLPVDEQGYQLVLQAYAGIIEKHLDALFFLPIPFPEESVYTLCFNFPNEGLQLYRYDFEQDAWTNELPDQAFYSLRSYPDDQALVLQEANSLGEANRLRLLRFQNKEVKLLLDKHFDGPSYRPIGWAEGDQVSRILLQSNDGQSEVNYGFLDLLACSEDGCSVVETPGYPTWSWNGQKTLFVDGSDIFLGDTFGQEDVFVGTGFNPFWIDSERYGFIRFDEHEGQVTTQLVTGSLNEPDLKVLLEGQDLGDLIGSEGGNNLFIQYATIKPAVPDLLILTASGVRGLAGEHFVFTYRLGGQGDLSLLMRQKGAPGGTPASLTPTGFPPIDISPDGRWLLLSKLTGDGKSTWSYYFLNLQESQPPIVTESFPILPAQFPFYDWSKDGRWLVIADHGFFRLVAPAHDYERLIPHDFNACGFTVWGGS